MLQDPLVWDWSESYEYYLKQSSKDLRSLKKLDDVTHLVRIKVSKQSENLSLIDVKKSSTKHKLPVAHWTICHYAGKTIYATDQKILAKDNTSEKFVEFLTKNYPDSLDWLLFHPEWL